MLKYGDSIPGSRFFRAFCLECKDPVRITKQRRDNFESITCKQCRPVHVGVGNGVEVFDDGEYDIDAFRKAQFSR